MKCPECQFENRDEAKFCSECGQQFISICSDCGSENLPGSKFCDKCGHKLIVNKVQYKQETFIKGERKNVTVLFSDMSGYTAMTERLDPEEVTDLMSRIFGEIAQVITKYEGFIERFIGDAVMAIFGVPNSHEDDPIRAIKAAREIHSLVETLSPRFEGKIGHPLTMHTGINTGLVVTGEVDVEKGTPGITGDCVNSASRLESLSNSGEILVGENTFRQAEGYFIFERLKPKRVKGKEALIKAYRVIAPSTRRTRFDVSSERGLTPFVGRETELCILLEGFYRAKKGRGQVFSIISEAGLGKSRLLYEFRKAVAKENVTFIEGKCLSYSQSVAYHPIIDILKSNFDTRDDDNDDKIREKVKDGLEVLSVDEVSALPYILELLSVKNSGINIDLITPEGKKERIIETIKLISIKGSEIRPLIIAIEDLHWMDKSSEGVITSLIDGISGARLFLLLTYRPEFKPTWSIRSYQNHVNLNRLSTIESNAMAYHLLNADDIDSDLEKLIHDKSEGTPFFLEEFIRSLKSLRMLEIQGAKCRLAEDAYNVSIPSTIQDVLMARIDSLAESAKDVLQTGSVVGREFNQDLIQAVTGLSGRELLSDLSVLKDSEFLYERGIYPQSSYIFIHALTQEVAYNSLLSKRRKGIHAAIGKAIESLHVQRLDEFYEILAYHYSKGDSFEKAYQYLKLSGNKTTRNYSNWEAFRFYKDAIEVLNQLSDSRDNKRKQIEVILLMSGPMMFLTYPEDSRRILEEGVRLCKKLNDKKSLATIYSLLGIYYLHRGKPLEAIKYSEIGFEEPRKLQELELMAPIARALCASYLAAGKFRETSDFAPMVIDLLEKAHKESDLFGAPFNTYSLLCAYYALSLAMFGNFEKATEYLKKGLHAASSINHLASLGVLEAMFGLMFIIKGDGTNSIQHFQNSIRYFEESKAVLIFAVSWSGLGSGYYYLGDLEAARKHIEKGIELTNRGGSEWWKSFHYLYLSKTHFDLGDQIMSRSSIEEALKISQNNSEKHFEGASWAFLGRILGKADLSQSDTAAEHILKGIKILDELKIKPWCAEGHLYLGELYANIGNREDALKNLRKAESVFQEIGMDYYLSKTQEILSRL